MDHLGCPSRGSRVRVDTLYLEGVGGSRAGVKRRGQEMGEEWGRRRARKEEKEEERSGGREAGEDRAEEEGKIVGR